MAARFAGLPQAQKHGVDFAAQPCQRVGIGAAFALRQQRADAAVEIQNGLALHFGRVRGQNGGNGRIVQLPLHRFAVGFPALSLRTVSVRLPSAALWYGIFVDLAAAFVVHVFGDIQNLGEQPAGKRQIVGLPFVQLRQYFSINAALSSEVDKSLTVSTTNGEASSCRRLNRDCFKIPRPPPKPRPSDCSGYAVA